MVASSEAVTMTEKTGWNITRVTGARCPLRAYLSGGRGIHSLGSLFWPTGPPCVISSFASFNFDSNSITWDTVEETQWCKITCIGPLRSAHLSSTMISGPPHTPESSNNLLITPLHYASRWRCTSSLPSLHLDKRIPASDILTFFCNLMTEVHFFSNNPAYFLSTSSF